MVNVTSDTGEWYCLLAVLHPPQSLLIALNLVFNNDDGTATTYNVGDIAFIICAMSLVFIMIPGVGFFYSGLLRRKNALSMIWTSMLSTAVVSFQVCPLWRFHSTAVLISGIVVLLGLFSRFRR